MSSDAARAAAALSVKRAIAVAANGDAAAARYLEIASGAARVLDDIVDGDRAVIGRDAVLVFQSLLVEIHANLFFQRHRDALSLLHLVALNAWLDANELGRSDRPMDRIYAHVLRDFVNELLPAVAYLTGGWVRLRQISAAEFRTPFMKPTKEETVYGNV